MQCHYLDKTRREKVESPGDKKREKKLKRYKILMYRDLNPLFLEGRYNLFLLFVKQIKTKLVRAFGWLPKIRVSLKFLYVSKYFSFLNV